MCKKNENQQSILFAIHPSEGNDSPECVQQDEAEGQEGWNKEHVYVHVCMHVRSCVCAFVILCLRLYM